MKKRNNNLVGVIMGSKSDWDVMKNCCETLKSFQIKYNVIKINIPVV